MRARWVGLVSSVVSGALALTAVSGLPVSASAPVLDQTGSSARPEVADQSLVDQKLTVRHRGDVSARGVQISDPRVLRNGRIFAATVKWDRQLLHKPGRSRQSLRLVALNGESSIVIATSAVPRTASTKQPMRLVVPVAKRAKLKSASQIVLAASQQWGSRRSKYFTKNYVAVTTARSGVLATRSSSSCGRIVLGPRADASGCNFTGADLSRADLSRINLSGSSLVAARLVRAKLTHADLANADVNGTNVNGAQLAGADVTGATGTVHGKPASGPTPGSSPTPPTPPVPPAPPAPTAPAIPVAPTVNSVSDQTVALSWTAPTDDGGSPITGYNLQVATTAGGAYTDATGCSNLAVVLTCTATSLTNGTTYYFKVAAKNAVGPSAYSPASASGTPSTIPAAPAAPTSSGAGDGIITLDWTAPSDTGGLLITGYNLQVSANSSSGFVDATDCSNLGVVLTCTASGLTNGTAYYFKVAAKNANGLGVYSGVSSAFSPTTIPGAPGTPTSSAVASATVTLHWTVPVDDGGSPVTGYNVQVSTDSSTGFADATDCSNLGVVLTCTASGLTNGTAYYFKVAAKNTAGTGSYSQVSDPFTPTPTCAEGGVCAIGDTGPGGGTVFYVADTPQLWGSYLEAAPSGWSGGSTDPALDWCSDQFSLLPGTFETQLGDGQPNTDIMLAASRCTSGAGFAARGYNGGGLTDWSLPSKDELNQLYLHKDVVAGLGSIYYSSSQTDDSNTWVQNFDTAAQSSGGKWNMLGTLLTRPTRAFGPVTPCADGGPCAIGDTGPGGGTVFYDAGSTQSWGRYLEAAPMDWDNGGDPYSYFTTSACKNTDFQTNSALGTGAQNTATIISVCGAGATAANIAAGYRGGGLSDWFLPSEDELTAMLQNTPQVVPANSGYYEFWSSYTYFDGDDGLADYVGLNTDVDPPTVENPDWQYRYGHYLYVRPVRAFTPAS